MKCPANLSDLHGQGERETRHTNKQWPLALVYIEDDPVWDYSTGKKPWAIYRQSRPPVSTPSPLQDSLQRAISLQPK